MTAAACIDAEPERVYAIIAAYHNGHRGILPHEFSALSVERGGVGAGTIIRFRMSVMGRRQGATGPVGGHRGVIRKNSVRIEIGGL